MAQTIQNIASGLSANDPPVGALVIVIVGQNPNWAFTPTGAGLFSIQNNVTGAFAAPGGAAGANVVAAAGAFNWLVQPNPNPGANVIITNPANGNVWDVPFGAQPGSPIQIVAPTGAPNQLWNV